MRKLTKTQLSLRSETVRYLSTASLTGVAGGKFRTPGPTNRPECDTFDDCPTSVCITLSGDICVV